MCKLLVIRDSVLFILGAGLIARELWTGSLDPMILEIGAGMTGVPAWLHHRSLTGSTDSTPGPISESSPSVAQPLESPNTSEGEA